MTLVKSSFYVFTFKRKNSFFIRNKDITISYQFRTLRAAFNRAIEAKIVSRDKNPFVEFKLSHLNTKTMKRALSQKDILRIMQADCSDCKPIRQLAQDLFVFSYLCGGISFVDIANLTPRNIIDNRLIYQRQKTHGGINLQLSPEAKKLIAKYADYQRGADYLFPILHYKRHITPIKLMELFNHSSIAITKRYLGLRQEEILETYDVLSF